MKREKGYKIPSTIDPGSYICVRAYIPNDPLYVAAFWGSYGFLTKWLAWETDDSKRGKSVAAVWQPLFDRARDEWLIGDGSCSFSPDPEADPIDLLDDILWGLKTIIEWIDTWLDDGMTAAEIKDRLYYFTPLYPGLYDLVDNMAGESSVDRQAAIDSYNWQELRDAAWCDEQCSLEDYSGPLGFIGWSQCAVTKVLEWIAGQTGLYASWLDDILSTAGAATGLDVLANIVPGGGELFDFDDPICPTVITYDFTLGEKLGWHEYSPNATIWTGAGWADGYPLYKSDDGISIDSPALWAGITIIRVRVTYSQVMTGNNPSNAILFWPGYSLQSQILDDRMIYVHEVDIPMTGPYGINVNFDSWLGGPNTHFEGVLEKIEVFYYET